MLRSAQPSQFSTYPIQNIYIPGLAVLVDVKIKEPYLKATVISTERARAVKAIMVSSFWLAWKSWARLWAKSWIPPEMELAPVPELIELEGTHLFRSGELKIF